MLNSNENVAQEGGIQKLYRNETHTNVMRKNTTKNE